MRYRPLLLSLAATAFLASGANAGPASCRLVTDPANDDRVANQSVPPPADTVGRDGDLDVLGGDVAVDGSWITAVIRTRSQRGLTSPDSPTGRVWQFLFTVGAERYAMEVATGPEGFDADVRQVTGQQDGAPGMFADPGLGGARVSFVESKREVHVSAPVSYFASHTPLKRGTVLRGLAVWSYRFYGVGGQRVNLPAGRVIDYGLYGAGTSVDSATSQRTYTVGTKSCVTPGR